MHSLKAIHDARRTRALPSSRTTLSSRPSLVSGASAPPFQTGTRLPPSLLNGRGQHHRTARHIQAGACWAQPKSQGAGGEKVEVGERKEEGGGEGSPEAKALAVREGGESDGQGHEHAKEDKAGALRREEPQHPPSVNSLPAQASPLEEDELDGPLGSVFLPVERDEDDWELLSVDEEDAIKLGYHSVSHDNEKAVWASVVVAPVRA
ncbi:hypothetical protein JCM8547_003994 [Rhodosporidiobolus lusitaniae]